MFPLTGDERWGGMLLVERRGPGFGARFVSKCGFINCAGVRDPVTCQLLLVVPNALLSYLIMSRFVFNKRRDR